MKLKQKARGGDIYAMRTLGMMYLKGGPDVDTEIDAGVAWLEVAADHGDSDAMRDLGFIYLAGIGVDKDPDVSLIWLQRAAVAGNVEAQQLLHKPE